MAGVYTARNSGNLGNTMRGGSTQTYSPATYMQPLTTQIAYWMVFTNYMYAFSNSFSTSDKKKTSSKQVA
jgi:hypothetical protein